MDHVYEKRDNGFFMRIFIHPQAKERPRFNKYTRAVYTPPKTIQFENAIKFALNASRIDVTDGLCKVHYVAYFKRPVALKKKSDLIYKPSRPDVDNLFKCFSDAANEVVWTDDSRVVDARIEKRYSQDEKEYIEFTVEYINQSE